MRKIVQVWGFLLCICAAPNGFASIISFDDIDTTFGDVSLDGLGLYEGLTWTNITAYTSFFGFDGFSNGIISPSNAAYSGGENLGSTITPVIGSFSSSILFNLDSLYLGAAYYDNLLVTIEGWRDGSLITSTDYIVDTTGATLKSLNIKAVDTVKLYSSSLTTSSDPFFCGTFNCTYFTFDDISVSEADIVTPTVSEPSSIGTFLILLILLTIGTGRFRFQK